MKTKTKKPQKPRRTVEVDPVALCHVLNYLFHDEDRHYQKCLDDGGDCSDHIFHSVMGLNFSMMRWSEEQGVSIDALLEASAQLKDLPEVMAEANAQQ